MRFESQLSRMNCRTFSTGLSSGHLGGSATRVMFGGTRSRLERCHPAWSIRSTAWAPGATSVAISARCRFMASVLQVGDQGSSLARAGADGAEDVSRGRALIVWCRGPRAPPGPPPRDLVLLADACLVREPDLYPVRSDALLPRDLGQAHREAFLKSSTAPSA